LKIHPFLTAAIAGGAIGHQYPAAGWKETAVIVVAHTVVIRLLTDLMATPTKQTPWPIRQVIRIGAHLGLIKLFHNAAWRLGPYAPQMVALYFRARPTHTMIPSLLILGRLNRVL
jgi:hypothetical protein